MTRQNIDDPGRPYGIVLSASTSLWLPFPLKIVFDFLRNENNRHKWDILSNGGYIQEVAHVTYGKEIGNCVSVLSVNSINSNQSSMLILQESSIDSTGSFVVYAPLDVPSLNIVLYGGEAKYVQLLSSGFDILPEGSLGSANSGGSFLTVAFQILVDNIPTTKLSLDQSIASVNNLMSCTINKINVALSSDFQCLMDLVH